ncbi:unnamed protein product [Nesidiocoris tenuis]|uniref:Uncharacterized protein n=1 Tax=Nesidiocoris tenuis TaxID=355587 RepID=A0A6H5H3G1_9HEMI|nr:unnamed protein product [Nesidiocoris tenuis]
MYHYAAAETWLCSCTGWFVHYDPPPPCNDRWAVLTRQSNTADSVKDTVRRRQDEDTGGPSVLVLLGHYYTNTCSHDCSRQFTADRPVNKCPYESSSLSKNGWPHSNQCNSVKIIGSNVDSPSQSQPKVLQDGISVAFKSKLHCLGLSDTCRRDASGEKQCRILKWCCLCLLGRQAWVAGRRSKLTSGHLPAPAAPTNILEHLVISSKSLRQFNALAHSVANSLLRVCIQYPHREKLAGFCCVNYRSESDGPPLPKRLPFQLASQAAPLQLRLQLRTTGTAITTAANNDNIHHHLSIHINASPRIRKTK